MKRRLDDSGPQVGQALTFLVLCFALCWVGKLVYGLFHPGTRIDRELTARDNLAFAIALGGYYLGILIVVGGPLSGPSHAVVGLVLLFVARWLTDWLLLPGVTIRHEVLEQEVPNVGVGYLEGLFYVGASLLIGWSL